MAPDPAHTMSRRPTRSSTLFVRTSNKTPAGEVAVTAKDEAEHEHDHEHTGTPDPIELARIAIVAVAAVAVWFRVWEPFPRVSVIGLIGVAVGGYPIFKEAWENIRQRRMTMELSMTLALVAALLIGQFFTALVITVFV